ncbi:acyltransferase family protein [Aquabacterium sp. A7-Y]|uniref:acyltransferase family protein n=1 Tax=Aquabacterium sp. A7-Y TaxID=1349605 RepID=UPI00223D166D|nr:acyltransferase family protein [Aquabacterium sp. A7-Y]MCW7541965.1 acyltransferase family protein [Aquabacterium sp. A7-Y]
MSRSNAGSVTQRRLYWLDGARASLMLLGVPFHAGFVYAVQGWEISSPDKSALLSGWGAASSAFRMPAFFLVAGFFAALLMSRRSRGDFLRTRLFRLGVPLITGLVLLAPIQVGLRELASGFSGPDGPLAQSFLDEGHLRPDAGRIWLAQLWFLVDLLIYTGLIALISTPAVLARLKAAGDWLSRLSPMHLLALVCLHGLYGLCLGAFDNLTGLSLPTFFWGGVMTQKLLYNLPFFLLGVICFLQRDLLTRLITWRRWSVPLCLLLLIACALWPAADRAAWQKAVRLFMLPATAWAGVHLVLGACARWLDRPSPVVQNLVDSAYSIYLLHIIPVFATGLAFCFVDWPVLLEFTLMVLISLLSAWGAHQLLNRYALYRVLLNGEPLSTLRNDTPAGAAAEPRTS